MARPDLCLGFGRLIVRSVQITLPPRARLHTLATASPPRILKQGEVAEAARAVRTLRLSMEAKATAAPRV